MIVIDSTVCTILICKIIIDNLQIYFSNTLAFIMIDPPNNYFSACTYGGVLKIAHLNNIVLQFYNNIYNYIL